jgi:hypothetical protein
MSSSSSKPSRPSPENLPSIIIATNSFLPKFSKSVRNGDYLLLGT